MQWFDVDKEGLGKLLEERGAAFAVLELIQNALDTNATNVSIDIEKQGTKLYRLVVQDDDPDGFSDLAHAFTLFAESEKKGQANKRGRFNLGEKLVLALCDEARIASTKGTVVFDAKGRRTLKAKTDVGSSVDLLIRLSAADVREVEKLTRTVLIPEGINLRLNSELLPERKAIRELGASLPTVIAGANGMLRNTVRKTEVRLVEVAEGEKPHLYEMGIPVVEFDTPFHVDVQQKVPLGFSRDAVTPGYARAVHLAVVNQAPDLVATAKEVSRGWVGDALESDDVTKEAVEAILNAKFEDPSMVLVFDPTDPQSKTEAQSQGYEVVGSRTFTPPAWENIRQHLPDLLPRAGLVTPSRNAVLHVERDNPETVTILERSTWTPLQVKVAEYIEAQASWLLGQRVTVAIVESNLTYLASWGARILTLNAKRLSSTWWEDQQQVDEIVIHEVSHNWSSDHLDHAFYEATIRLGAKLRYTEVEL